MQRMDLAAEAREAGKGVARRLRTEGKIPAVLYGEGTEVKYLSVDARELGKLKRKSGEGFNFLVDLKIANSGSSLAMIKDYQADVLKRNLTHIDFLHIDINKPMETEVPILLVGIPLGVKDSGGVVDQLRRTINVRALPNNIPAHIEINIEALNIGDSIHADQIALPSGVEFLHTTNFTVVSIVHPSKVEAAPAAVPVEGAEGAEGAAPAEGAATAEGAAGVAAPADGKAQKSEKAPKKDGDKGK